MVYKLLDFYMAAIRTAAAVIITVLWIIVPKPVALIIPGNAEIPQVLNNFTYMQDQERESAGSIEIEVQVTGGSLSRLGRNLYEELRDHYYIHTRLCHEEALMDFATIRVYQSGWSEIEFEFSRTACEIRDISWTIPYDYDPNDP